MPKLVGTSIEMSYVAIDEAGRVWRGTLRHSRAEADHTTSTGRRPRVPEQQRVAMGVCRHHVEGLAMENRRLGNPGRGCSGNAGRHGGSSSTSLVSVCGGRGPNRQEGGPEVAASGSPSISATTGRSRRCAGNGRLDRRTVRVHHSAGWRRPHMPGSLVQVHHRFPEGSGSLRVSISL